MSVALYPRPRLAHMCACMYLPFETRRKKKMKVGNSANNTIQLIQLHKAVYFNPKVKKFQKKCSLITVKTVEKVNQINSMISVKFFQPIS